MNIKRAGSMYVNYNSFDVQLTNKFKYNSASLRLQTLFNVLVVVFVVVVKKLNGIYQIYNNKCLRDESNC